MPQTMFPEEQNQFDDTLFRSSPMQPPTGPWYGGLATAAPLGLATSVGKVAELGASEAAQEYGSVIKTTKTALQLVGADFPAAQEIEKQDPDELQTRVTRNADAYYKATRMDPQTTGAMAQVINQFSDVAGRVGIGAAFGGAGVGAVVAGASEFAPAERELEAQGIDKDTATQLAAAQSVMTGAGALLPGGVGAKTAVRMASGAAINLTVGAASRYNTHQVLEDAGYKEQAQQYRVFDGQSMATDILLGSFFGWMHSPEEPFSTPRIPQDVVDAGLVHLQAKQAEIDLAPGVPKTPEARDAHVQALDATTEAMVKGDPLPDVEAYKTAMDESGGTLPNPAQDAAREAAADAGAQASKEATDGVVSGSKKANEPPKTTEQWVAEQIDKEKAQAKAESLSKLSRAEREQQAALTTDPETQTAIDAVKDTMAKNPELHDFEYTDPETGETAKASDVLDQVTDEARNAKNEGLLHEIAAACAIT